MTVKAKVQTEERIGGGVDHRLAKAFAHPLRVEILTILNERVASPNDLAKELDEGLSLVSYHVKVLKDYECIELVSTRPRRGATEHFYRALKRPHLTGSDWKNLPRSAQEEISASAVQMIVGEVAEALEAGTFDARSDRHISRTPLVVDETGWVELGALMDETLEKVLAVQTESAARMAESGEDGILAKAVLMNFESPAPE